MATYVQTQSKLWVDGYDWSGDMNAMALEHSVEAQDDTVFGDSTRSNAGGLKMISCAHEGLYTGGATEDKVYFDKIGTADTPMTICPTTGAYGERAYFFKSMLSQYSPQAQIGEMMRFSVTGVGTGDLIQGNVLFPMTTATSTSTSTGQVLGACGATETVYAALHVTAASAADTLDVVIQSDTSGFSSPTTRITFAQKAAIGSEYATLGPAAITDTYWRISYTIGGSDPSFTFAVVLGIQ